MRRFPGFLQVIAAGQVASTPSDCRVEVYPAVFEIAMTASRLISRERAANRFYDRIVSALRLKLHC